MNADGGSGVEGMSMTPSGSAGTSGLRTNVLTDPSRLNGFRSMKRHRPAELFRKDLISGEGGRRDTRIRGVAGEEEDGEGGRRR